MSVLDPPLPRRPRTAAVQSVNESPTAGVVARRSQAIADRSTIEELHRKQSVAALLADGPPASYPVSKVQTTIAQVEPVLEVKDGPEWAAVEDSMLLEALDEFQWRSLNLDLKDLAGLMAYHRMVTGEHVVVTVSVGEQIDYRIYPVQACAFNKPKKGQVTIREVANGSVKAGTAYVVPKTAVHRCWNPHSNYPGQAWSPILAGVEPLQLCASLARLMRKHSDSRATAGGGKAMIYSTEDGEQQDDDGNEFDPIARAVADFGIMTNDETDLRGLLPLMLRMNLRNVESKPFMLDLVGAFEPKLIEWWNAALQRFAQAINLAGLTVAAGGAGTSTNWNEWVVGEDNWKGAFAPFADAIYDDITRLFLHGTYRDRLGATDITEYRVHYDPASVIVPPDKKATAAEFGKEGILRAKAQATAGGFDDEDLLIEPDWDREAERNWFLQVKSAGRVQPGGGPPETISVRGQEEIDPATGKSVATGEDPAPVGGGKPQPVPSGTAPTPQAQGKKDATGTRAPAPARAAAATPTANAQRAINRLAKLRRQTGHKMQVKARAAVDNAIRNATGRAAGIAGSAKQGTRLAAVTRQFDDSLTDTQDGPLVARRAEFRRHGIPAPILAALGLTEEELLADDLGVYIDETGSDLETYMQKRRDILEAEGFDPDLAGQTSNASDAALFLGAGAMAIARGALTDGVAPPTAAGEWSGIVPFSLVGDALQVAAGTLTSTLPSSPDDTPTTASTGNVDAEVGIAEQLGMETVYTWVHGASGEPDRPYDPHVEIDGEEFRDPEVNDDGIAVSDWEAPDEFTDGDTLYPQDHPGCTCDWDIELVEPEGGTSLNPAPGEASL